jgi:hypothetical protein
MIFVFIYCLVLFTILRISLCIIIYFILLILYIYRGHTDLVQYFIKRGADVHCRNASGINIEY